MRQRLLLLFVIVGFSLPLLSCNNESRETADAFAKEIDTPASKPSFEEKKKKLSQGKGSMSFRIDGVLYETDPNRTKCWTTDGIPLVMLAAHGENLTVSWQLNYPGENTNIHVDRDNKGGISFKIGNNKYWIRSRAGDNFLDIVFTESTDKFSIKLLSGTFQGVLEDAKGNKVQITEGKFQTDDI